MADWSIVVREREVNVGPLDNMYYGQNASHTYLALVNGHGKTIAEMHGLSCHPDTGEQISPGMGLLNLADIVADTASLSNLFEHVVDAAGLSANRLRIIVEDRASKAPHDSETLIASGDEPSIMRRWVHASRAAIAINDADLIYKPFSFFNRAVNCNSVTNTLARMVAGVNLDEHFTKYVSPGLSTDLRTHIPTLKSITAPNGELGILRTMYKDLRRYLPSGLGLKSSQISSQGYTRASALSMG